jgi:lysozyme
MDVRTLLIREEGVQLRPYRCPTGKLSIGVGRNLDDVGITRQEAEILFENDLMRATAAVMSRLPWAAQLDEPRQAVLISLAFQMGVGSKASGTGLLGFTRMLAAMERSAWDEAAIQLLDSRLAKQTPERTERLATQLRFGEWT